MGNQLKNDDMFSPTTPIFAPAPPTTNSKVLPEILTYVQTKIYILVLTTEATNTALRLCITLSS
jgi:hypothetical protein